MSDTLSTIGKRLTGTEQRDAIHIAVAPVVTAGFLRPGERVMFEAGSTERVVAWESDVEPKPIGVIDPFLESSYVAEGTRCWLFLMPASITSLRHVWTHPAFEIAPVAQASPQAGSKAESERWLRGFADRYGGDYTEMIAAAVKGESYCFGSDIEYGDFAADAEFWQHIERATGRQVPTAMRENNGFRCAC